MKSFSIIITYYQGKQILLTSLVLLKKSLKKYSDYEIIIVNDNPKEKLVESEIATESHIKIINLEKNVGYAGACNIAVASSTKEYIILMDVDIMVTEDWLQPLFDVYDSEKNVGAVAATILTMHNHSVVHWGLGMHEIELIKPYRNGELPPEWENKLQQFSLLASGCLLVQKKIYLEVNGMDEIFYNGYCDLDFTLKIHYQGYLNFYSSSSIVYHRGKVAGHTRLLSSSDTRAVFVRKWAQRLPNDGLSIYSNILKLRKNDFSMKNYGILNFSKSLFLNDYLETLCQACNIKTRLISNLKSIEFPAVFEDFLPWSLCQGSEPIIYFFDDATIATENFHWFYHRKNKGDVLLDRNGNMFLTDTLI